MNNQKLLNYCNDYFNYNPITGIITWKRKAAQRVTIGDEAGAKLKIGYRHLSAQGKLYYSHRIAFLMSWGFLPKFIDHANGVKDDNRLCNLREATSTNNSHNTGVKKGNKSGYKGVYLDSKKDKWRSQIRHNGKRKHLGTFRCKHEAAKSWNKAALKYHGEFAYQNIIMENK